MIDNYFRITCVKNSTDIQIDPHGSITTTSIEYRTSYEQTWRSYTLSESIPLSYGEWVEFRNTSGTFSLDSSNYLQFYSLTSYSPHIEVSGNVMSLLDYRVDDLAIPKYAFYYMFSNVATLTNASNLLLPSKTLNASCYRYMFSGCSSLTKAPELPATTLAGSCYSSMFSGCSSLTKAPELPATTLQSFCYYKMFSGCTSLTTLQELPATTLIFGCYGYMFSGCTSLIAAPELPATTLATGCYSSMFSGCSSLTKAPELPEATKSQCFNYMFQNCTKLSEVVYTGATFVSSERFTSWLSGASSTGTFYYTNQDLDISKIPRTTSGVPEGWEIKYGRPSTKMTFQISWKTVNTLYLNGKAVKTLFVDGKKIYG